MTATVPVAPRPVFRVTDGRHRDRAVARDACVGRFTMAGCTLDLGDDLPWLRPDVHPDREWWIEWSKGYYGLDLAAAFVETGDTTFLRTWESLVAGWVRHVPPSFGPTDAIGRRLQNWIYAWLLLDQAGAPLALDHTLVDGMLAQAAYLQGHLTPERNHRTLELYALLIVALAFDGHDADGTRRAFAWDALHENLLADVRPDGVHREQSTHYHMVALRSFVGARENARRFGLTVPPSYDARLARAVEFAASLQRPDGSIPTLSDSDTADYRDLLRLAASLLDRPDILFVASNGREGVAPSTTSRVFPDGGYAIQRGTWAARNDGGLQRHLTFDCGPIGDGGHGHYDVLSIDAWAGQPLVVDPGRYTYFEGPAGGRNWRHWFKGTAAHNTVCVDGLDQVAYRPGRPRGEMPTARLLAHGSSADAEWFAAEARSPRYDAVHRRCVIFVAGDYWIVIDDLRAPSAHQYDLRWHLAPAAHEQTALQPGTVIAPDVTLLIDGAGTLALEEGWVSPTYGVRQPAPVVSAMRPAATDAHFVSVILPSTTGHTTEGAPVSRPCTPTLTVHTGPDEVLVIVDGAGPTSDVTDTVRWTNAGIVVHRGSDRARGLR